MSKGRESSAPEDSKRPMRDDALRRRRALDPGELSRISKKVEENLVSMPEFKAASLVVSYCALKDEVQTRPIIERAIAEGKRVAVVVADPKKRTLSFSEIDSFEGDLEPGSFGIMEPKAGRGRRVPLDEADVVLVPLVAWDDRGHRLGYGAGYFDRGLKGADGVLKVGLAMESQRVEAIPQTRHDVPLDVIVTEKRVLRVNK